MGARMTPKDDRALLGQDQRVVADLLLRAGGTQDRNNNLLAASVLLSRTLAAVEADDGFWGRLGDAQGRLQEFAQTQDATTLGVLAQAPWLEVLEHCGYQPPPPACSA